MQKNIRRCGRVISPSELGLTKASIRKLQQMRTALGRHPEATPHKVTQILQYALQLAKGDGGIFFTFLPKHQ